MYQLRLARRYEMSGLMLLGCIPLAVLIMASTSYSQDCPSRAHNRQMVSMYYEEQAAVLEKLIDEWNSKYSQYLGSYEEFFSKADSIAEQEGGDVIRNGRSVPEGPPTRVELDENYKTHYYIGEVNRSGDLEWKEVDHDPREWKREEESGEDHVGGDIQSWLEQEERDRIQFDAEFSEERFLARFQERTTGFAGALVANVEEIPCDVYLNKITCTWLTPECMLQWSETSPMGVRGTGVGVLSSFKEIERLKSFYDSLGAAMKKKELSRSRYAWAPPREQSKFEMPSTQEAENTDRRPQERSDPLKENPGLFSQATPTTELLGRRDDSNGDGKVDRIVVNRSDGSSIVYWDDDGDGMVDWSSVSTADGSETLFIDSDKNGLPDQRAEIGPDGKPTYFPLDEGEIESAMNPSHNAAGAPSSLESNTGNSPNRESDVEKRLPRSENEKDVITVETWKKVRGELENAKRGMEATSIAEEFVSDNETETFSGTASQIIGYLKTGWDALVASRDSTNIEARAEVAQGLFDHIAGAAGNAGGALAVSASAFGKLAPPVSLWKDVFEKSLGRAEALLTDGEPGPEGEVLVPIADWFGDAAGIGKVGTRSMDFRREGHKAWSDLRKTYGWIGGTKRKIWYWLLEDAQQGP